MPPPTPGVVELLDFSITEDAPGSYLLVCEGAEHGGDSWHPSLEAALLQAEEEYGIGRAEWTDVDESLD